MFQVGTVEPRVTGVASNGYLRRKTGQKRFCRFTTLEQATRNCSILMVFVDCQFPQESLAAQGFSREQIEDIMSYFEKTTGENSKVVPHYKRRIADAYEGAWEIKNPKPVYRVQGLPVTVALVPYVRYEVDQMYGEDDYECIAKPVAVEPREPKEQKPDSFDNLDGRLVSLVGRSFYFNTPWPADTRWSILMPLREFYQHVEWDITRMLDTGSMSERTEKVLERHTNQKQSYFDSSAYIYYP